MTSRTVQFISYDRVPVATARVTDTAGFFSGSVDLSRMPSGLLQKFEEYEEIVGGQMFSLLDEIEEQINKLSLKVAFDEGWEAPLEDLQIYPSTKRVSFKVGQKTGDGKPARPKDASQSAKPLSPSIEPSREPAGPATERSH